MAEIAGIKTKQPFSRRVLFPAGLVLGVWVVLNFLTGHLEWFGSGQAYRLRPTPSTQCWDLSSCSAA